MTKHRPQTLDEVIGQDHIIRSLKNLLVNIDEFPHLLFYGPQGTGKTTVTKALARTIYGNEWERVVREINASNERRIAVVRGIIEDFCRTSSTILDVDRKLLILEEFDGFGTVGQHALRRNLEEYAYNVITIMTCNYPKKIIKPLRSRCAMMRFVAPRPEHIKEYITRIANLENLVVEEDTLWLIANNSYEDFRPAVNILQTAVVYDNSQRCVTTERVMEVASVITDEEVRELMDLIETGEVKKATHRIDSLMASGISPEMLIDMLFRYGQRNGILDIDKENGIEALNLFADVSAKLAENAIPSIVMTYFVSRFHKIRSGK